MAHITFGTNLCFAVKRWPRVEDWAPVAAGLGMDEVQFTFDLLDPLLTPNLDDFLHVRRVAERHGVTITSAFTGFVAYSQNLLAHPSYAQRDAALRWYENAVRAAARLGARSVGGHIGAMSAAETHDPERREASVRRTVESVRHLCRVAAREGLDALLWEAMPVAGEYPSTIVEAEELMTVRAVGTEVPVRLCIDVGHACRAGASGQDRDPNAWLRRVGAFAAVIHLQQTDGALDRHWPFTAEHAAAGVVDPAVVVEIARSLPQQRVELMLEVIHPFEATDETVVGGMRASIAEWRRALSATAATAVR